MSSFHDFDKFKFVLMEDGHLTPVHYRDLGEKEGHLYSKKVSWVDATINDVPLEQTFQYENEIDYICGMQSSENRGYIVVNERTSRSIPVEEDLPQIQKKWLNRLDKVTMGPLTLPQAKKKKKGPQRYPVKPKSDKQEDIGQCKSEKFQELVEKQDHGILGSHIYKIRCKDGYEKIVSWDDGDDFGFNVKKEVRYQPKTKEVTYCPPIHYLEPEIRWRDIWVEMDEIEHGYQRDHFFVPEGELCPDKSCMGPAIYFFQGPCKEEASREKYWKSSMYKHWITATNVGSGDERIRIKDSQYLSDAAYLERAKKEYLENPNEDTLYNYRMGWKLSQPGFRVYYLNRWRAGPYYKKDEIAPSPHL